MYYLEEFFFFVSNLNEMKSAERLSLEYRADSHPALGVAVLCITSFMIAVSHHLSNGIAQNFIQR